jgi:hypothetical protein
MIGHDNSPFEKQGSSVRGRTRSVRGSLAFLQTLIAAKMLALFSEHRLRDECRHLVLPVRLMKSATADGNLSQPPMDPAQGPPVCDADNDQMRMLETGRYKKLPRENRGMTGLNDLLGK